MRKRGANHRGKRAFLSPANRIALMSDISDKAKNVMSIQAWQALNEIKAGRGDESHFSTLACAINVTAVLANDGFGKEFSSEVLEAMQALMRISKRGKELGRWVGDGIGYDQIAKGIEIHEQQMGVVTAKKMVEAVLKVDDALKDQGDRKLGFA